LFGTISVRPPSQLLDKSLYGGIGWHAKVSARREGDRTDLRAVRNAAALELLGEEAPVELLQPFFNRVFAVGSDAGADVVVLCGEARVAAAESKLREAQDFARFLSPAEEMIEEKVVKLVGTNEVFCLLLDIAIVVGRNQLG